MSEFASDITVVGGGIAGLWTAKELIERGYSVNLVEKAGRLATGATTRNEGWLHAGTYHSLAIYDDVDAEAVTARTIYGHDSIVEFAPECIDHEDTYAFIKDEGLARRALYKWQQLGVPFREVSQRRFADDGIAMDRVSAAFAVKDKSVNSVELCRKLAAHIIEGGGRIFLGADYRPVDEGVADLVIGSDRHTLRSDATVVSAGPGTKGIIEGITGDPFQMRYFKSHLLVAPRLTKDNYFYVDPMEAGIMSHGDGSIVGINREAITQNDADCKVVKEKGTMLHSALADMIPATEQLKLGRDLKLVACVKVDVSPELVHDQDLSLVVQDLNIQVFEPANNYICALPGKMTEAPALGRAAADYVESGSKSVVKPRDAKAAVVALQGSGILRVKSRPMDRWLNRRSASGEASAV